MSKRFNPPLLLRNRHIQTLYAPLFRKDIALDMQIERFDFDDGDFVEAYWHNRPLVEEARPIVILLHGLEGSYRSPYIQGIMSALSNIEYSSVLMHFRGCGSSESNLARSYHSGDTQDARLYIESIAQKHTLSPLHAIGYSIGGNVLLKLLSEWRENSPLKSAISVSAPMQLDICASTMMSGFARIYQAHLLKYLKRTLLNKYHKHDIASMIGVTKEDVKKIKSIREFDERYTAQIHGFGTAQNYYNISSAKQYLHLITTPTLIIHSIDDPFMTPQILPSRGQISSSIKLEITKYGGHVGFVGGSIWRPTYWLEERIVEYIETKS